MQGWNHDFMMVEADKLIRMLLGDGIGLDLPDGAKVTKTTLVLC